MDLTDLTMILSTIQADPSEDDFQNAVKDAGSIMIKLDDEHKLILYGLYKQCTEGDAPMTPTADTLIEKHKWKAWHSFRGYPMMDARKAYIYLVNEQKKNFADDVDFTGVGSSVSTLYNHNQDEQWDQYHELHRMVIQNDIQGIEDYIAANKDINARDENGLSALHHAADRGNLEMCKFLLKHNIDQLGVDHEGQLALDYAIICEYQEIVMLLS